MNICAVICKIILNFVPFILQDNSTDIVKAFIITVRQLHIVLLENVIFLGVDTNIITNILKC